MSTPHGIHDEAILQFAIHMTQLVSSLNLSSYSSDNTTAFVKDVVYLIKYQKFLYGEISGTRYFMPLPTEQKYIEIEEELVARSLEKETLIEGCGSECPAPALQLITCQSKPFSFDLEEEICIWEASILINNEVPCYFALRTFQGTCELEVRCRSK
jgi:hypothetical protein